MNSALRRRLEEFVNRSEEFSEFEESLKTGDPPIIVFWGSGGIGKSLLLTKMIHHCSVNKLNKSEITWTDTRNHNYLAIMRKIRDDFGAQYFNTFTDLVNYFTVSQYELNIKFDGSINVAENAHIEAGTVGDIAGIIIKDLMIPVPRDDLAVPEDEKLTRLTDKFIDNFSLALADLPPDKPLIVFMDTVEKMSDSTKSWIWEELFDRVSKGLLPNVRFVLCGREEPPPDVSRDIMLVVAETELKPLLHEHIVEYLEKRGIDKKLQDALATMVMAQTDGNPLQIANNVDSFLRTAKNKSS